MPETTAPPTNNDRAMARHRLAALIEEAELGTTPGLDGQRARGKPPPDQPADWSASRAGRLVERWLPGGTRSVDGVRAFAAKHPLGLCALVLAVVVAIITAVLVANQQPTTESAPALPPAISAMANNPDAPTTTARAPTHLVISVVGRVLAPGLVTLPNGARVADAVKAAGGTEPNTDIGPLNLARKLSDGEQLYVGVPVPSGASEDQPTDPPSPADSPPATKKGHKSAADLAPGNKINLNTATADQLLALPGVGPSTAQRIVTWRTQHGRFTSVGQLRDVGGIGPAKLAKLAPLVTT